MCSQWQPFIDRQALLACLAAFALAMCVAAPALGTEIQVRREARPTTDLVRLGDVAKVYGDKQEVARLSQIALFPAPADGQRRFVRLREIQDHLAARGEDLRRLSFSGSSQVTVGHARAAAQPAVRLTSATQDRLQAQVEQAIAKYVSTGDRTDGLWEVDVQLSASQAKRLAAATEIARVRSGQRPQAGRQQFEIVATDSGGQATTTTVEALLTAPSMEVVAVRALGRGAIIGASDVELRTIDPKQAKTQRAETLDRLEAVIGKETRRALAADRPITVDAVRSPILVRRGEAVTVYARKAGITVRTVARANVDGGEGELIEVESLSKNRKRFDVRVTGQGTAEVMAGGAISRR